MVEAAAFQIEGMEGEGGVLCLEGGKGRGMEFITREVRMGNPTLALFEASKTYLANAYGFPQS